MFRLKMAIAALVLAVGCSSGGVRNKDRLPPGEEPPCGEAGMQSGPLPMEEQQPLDDAPVVNAARPPPPISGGTLAVLSDASVAVADSDRDALWLVGNDRATIRRVDFRPGDEPGRVVEGAAGRVFVALRNAGSVAEVDLASGAIVARHAVCAAPRGMAWISHNATLAVACATGTLVRLSFDASVPGALTFLGMATSRPADDLRDVVSVGPDLYLSTFRAGRLLHVDFEGRVSERSLSANSPFIRGVAWRMIAATGGVVIAHQWSSTAEIGIQKDLCGASVAGSGDAVYGGPEGDPRGLVFGGLAAITAYEMRDHQVGFASPPVGVDVAMSGSGDWVVAAHLRGALAGGQADSPRQLTDKGELVSAGWVGDTAVLFSRQPASLIYWKDPVRDGSRTTLTLPGESVRSTGHELFYRLTRSGLSCASCHPEAGEDARVWNLPEGPRRTPSLRGGLGDTAPFHWSGNLSGMEALVDDVMVHRMGGQALSPARSQALQSWLDAVPARPPPSGIDDASAARGKLLFESAAVGCSSCHSGVQGTNNALANVGTDGSFQVPRLRELGSRAPYFHDGRIAKLEDRFIPQAGGDLHGKVSGLSAAERTDLVAYLRSL